MTEHLSHGQLQSSTIKILALEKDFELWMQKIAQYTDASGDANPSSYYKSATVYQLGRGGSGKKADGDGENKIDPT